MGFSLNNAAAAAASGVADVATTYAKTEIGTRAALKLEDHRAAALAERDARQNEFTIDRDNARQAHTKELQDRGFTHAEGMESGRQEHAERLQKTSIEAAAEEHRLNREVTRAGQGIQARQVAVLEQGAALDREIKQIQLGNAKEVEALRKAHGEAKTPEERARISENIHILTGKDSNKILPLPIKDDMGNTVGYQFFDVERRQIIDGKPPQSGGAGAKDDPLGIRGSLPAPKAGAQPAAPAAASTEQAKGTGIPGAAPMNPEAQRSFDADVKSLPPKDLVEKYKATLPSLSPQQQFAYYEAEQKMPSRVPFIGLLGK